MKDYRLSEMRDICAGHFCERGACEYCEAQDKELHDFCQEYFGTTCPASYSDIEPRDMIELPCKCKSTVNRDWLVYYKSKYDCGLIEQQAFSSEAEADAFLAELKGDKK